MTSNHQQRVVITGLGLVSPLGSDLDTVWESLIQGRSGIARIDSLPTGSLPCHSGGQVKDFTGSIEDYGPLDKPLARAIKKNMKVMCREIEMGVAAAQKALAHSGLGMERDPQRCGCLFGCDYILTRPEEYADGVRNCRRVHANGHFDMADWPANGLGKVNPLWLLKYLPNMPNSHVSIYNDFRGPNNSITVREASMNLAIAESASIIQRGAADVMVVGATGSRIHPLRTAHVALWEPLASERAKPAEMARPFDRTSDGMVLGEGAGALVLESYAHAQARQARIWGEFLGCGSAMVGPRPSEKRDFMRQSIRQALQTTLDLAGQRLPARWHLHAHGLSIPEVDRSEGLAIADVLGHASQIPVTAAKSYYGNLGAGSAAVELICSLLAMERKRLFPIQNLHAPADYVSWPIASDQMSPGDGFVHASFTLQGQSACVAIAGAEHN